MYIVPSIQKKKRIKDHDVVGDDNDDVDNKNNGTTGQRASQLFSQSVTLPSFRFFLIFMKIHQILIEKKPEATKIEYAQL